MKEPALRETQQLAVCELAHLELDPRIGRQVVRHARDGDAVGDGGHQQLIDLDSAEQRRHVDAAGAAQSLDAERLAVDERFREVLAQEVVPVVVAGPGDPVFEVADRHPLEVDLQHFPAVDHPVHGPAAGDAHATQVREEELQTAAERDATHRDLDDVVLQRRGRTKPEVDVHAVDGGGAPRRHDTGQGAGEQDDEAQRTRRGGAP